ncbi:MAG: hypothetical protein N2442_10125 [Spirochaetes bacterium]|nr:hypothetical protein [Spirochaetota bacterium]
MRIKLSSLRLAALFVLSVTLIAFELAVMRSFAVGSWSNFGAMVISIALLGYGLAGTLLTFLEEKIRRNADRWLYASALLLTPSMTLSHIGAQKVPFNPLLITMDSTQILWIASYYLIYSLPFLIGAVFIGVSFIAFRDKIHKLYFWNMLGSGIGGFFILGLMYLLPPDRLLGPLVILSSIATFLCVVEYRWSSGSLFLNPWKVLMVGMASVVSIGLFLVAGDIRVSDFKPISYARKFPDAKHVYHAFGPLGEFDAFQSSYFHFAPGLSDNASSNIARMPQNAYVGLYIDGDGPIGVMRKLKPGEEAYIDYLPMAAPYKLMKDPNVLLLRLGGGIGAFSALHHGARAVTVVENNPYLLRMLKYDPFFREFTNNLLYDPRIRVIQAEPRAFTGSTNERFDLVEISLIDSIGLSSAGGYPIVENFTYTVEGIRSYLSCLKPNGVLAVTVWNRLTPPRNVPKLLSTVVMALKKEGVAQPEKQMFVFDLLLSTATVLVKKTPFNDTEIQTLLAFCKKMSFNPCFYPGKPNPPRSFEEILEGYAVQMKGGTSNTDLIPEELYQYTVSWLTQGKERDLFKRYVFNIDPATDDRPYYTAYVKPASVPLVVKNLKDLSEEWGYILLVATFLVSLLFGALIIAVPAVGRWEELFQHRKGTLQVLVYFSCLGIAYMLVEIFLIQRLSFFLEDPIFSTSVVITAMLVLSGIGSLTSGRSSLPRNRLLTFAVLGISLSLLFYIFLLSPLLDALLGAPLVVKILLSILFIAPSAFFLGMPFPTGLSYVSQRRPNLIPWAWGVNGCLSVTGSVLARLASVSLGYRMVLLGAILLYLLAWWMFQSLARENGSESLHLPKEQESPVQ